MEFTFSQSAPAVCLPCRQPDDLCRLYHVFRDIICRFHHQGSLKTSFGTFLEAAPDFTFSFDSSVADVRSVPFRSFVRRSFVDRSTFADVRRASFAERSQFCRYGFYEVIDFIFQILPSTKAAPNSSQSKIAMTRTSILLSSLTNSVSGCTLTTFCFSQIHLPVVSVSEYQSIGRN